MSAINPNSLSKFVGILEVAPAATPTSFVRVASVRGLIANFDVTANQVEVKADETGTVFKGYLPEARIEGSFLENVDRDLMNMFLGGTTSSVAGTLVSGADQVVASGAWSYNGFIKIANQNGNGSAITVNSVTGSVNGVLVAGTDYFVGKNEAGEYGITIIDSTTVTTLVQNMAIDYDYTPNASESISLPIIFSESPTLVARITATNTDGKIRRVTMTEATFEGVYGLDFLDVVENGDINGTTFTFKANKGSYFTLYNEII